MLQYLALFASSPLIIRRSDLASCTTRPDQASSLFPDIILYSTRVHWFLVKSLNCGCSVVIVIILCVPKYGTGSS